MVPESAYVSSLVQGDIEHLRSVVCGLIDKFYLDHDPRESLDKTFITELISNVHVSLDILIDDLDKIRKVKFNEN